MSRAGLPPPGTHNKARACPSSQDDSERGHLCWMNLKGTADATCFSPSVSQISAMLVYHLNAWPSGSCLLIAEFCFFAFHCSKGFSLFPFFVLHSRTAWYLVSVLFPPLRPHPETGALTHRDRVRQHLLCAHPAPGIVLNSPPASSLGYKPLRPACTGAILQMRRLRLTEVYNLRR